MAGLGAKLWTVGEVATAANINGYLQDQTVMKFASDAARDAAFGGAGEPTLSEGMYAYTADTDTLWFYTGSAWEVATIKPSVIDAKGDLLAGTAADTVGRLAVGTNGQMLTADSTASTGMKWMLPKVLQVVQATTSTIATSSSVTYADTGLTCTITPSSASSTVLVLVSQAGCSKSAASGFNALGLRLMRGATDIHSFSQFAGYNGNAAAEYLMIGNQNTVYLDSPATTSATTYKTQFRNPNGNIASVAVQDNIGGVTNQSTITLVEISA